MEKELTEEIKDKIIKSLNLEETSPEDIDEKAPLFGNDGLGLDSIDALELIVMLEKDYGIKMTDPSEGKDVFKSVETIAEYVTRNRTK